MAPPIRRTPPGMALLLLPIILIILLLVRPAAASRPHPDGENGDSGGLLLSPELAAAAARHLGLPASFAWSSAPEWGAAADVAVLNRTLAGGGFHRDLTYTLALQGPAAALVAGVAGGGEGGAAAPSPPPRQVGRLLWRMAGFDKTTAGPGACVLTVVQPLPPGLFADPYQLEGAVRAAEQRRRRRRRLREEESEQRRRRQRWWPLGGGSGKAGGVEDEEEKDAAPDGFRLLGPLDLELPAPACLPTALVVHKRLRRGGPAAASSSSSSSSSSPGGPVVVRRLRVPLHAKYPAAVLAASSPAGLGNSQALVPVPPPLLLLRCGGGGGGGGESEGGGGGDGSSDGGGAATTSPPSRERVWRPPRRLPASEALSWPVPAGAGAHLALASWGTFWASMAAAAAIVWAVWREAPRLRV